MTRTPRSHHHCLVDHRQRSGATRFSTIFERAPGFADRSGPSRYNVALSRRRAEAVQAYFVGHAVDPALMTIRAFGEDPDHLRVKTPDGVQEVQNRRVEITYGPGPNK